MSQNRSQHESSRTGGRLPSSGDLVVPITATVREQQPLDTDLTAVVLRSVADRFRWLSTPDVLALRAQLAIDVDDQVSLDDRVGVIVDAFLSEVEHWKRGAVA
jgi:hypothetical protein